MHANAPDQAGLEKTADFVNYILALSTGALVFSAELIKKDYPMSLGARDLILISWALLAVSILCGILAYMRIPVMLSEANHDLEDKLMIVPGRIQQVTFLFGMLFLGLALAILLWNRSLDNSETKSEAKRDCIQCVIQSPTDDRFVIAQSGKVVGKNGKAHYHTFLLNSKSGESWQMVCAENGRIEFRRVVIEGLAPNSKQPQAAVRGTSP
jgi:hypothetical protein